MEVKVNFIEGFKNEPLKRDYTVVNLVFKA